MLRQSDNLYPVVVGRGLVFGRYNRGSLGLTVSTSQAIKALSSIEAPLNHTHAARWPWIGVDLRGSPPLVFLAHSNSCHNTRPWVILPQNRTHVSENHAYTLTPRAYFIPFCSHMMRNSHPWRGRGVTPMALMKPLTGSLRPVYTSGERLLPSAGRNRSEGPVKNGKLMGLGFLDL